MNERVDEFESIIDENDIKEFAEKKRIYLVKNLNEKSCNDRSSLLTDVQEFYNDKEFNTSKDSFGDELNSTKAD